MTVKEVERLTGVSVRTLHHYDRIGLLRPLRGQENGYRDYGEEDLWRLSQILLYRELRFPLGKIAEILDSPDYDRNRALTQQIELLTREREHIDNLLTFAIGIRGVGVKHVDFSAFDARRLDEYVQKTKEALSQTDAWKEYAQRGADSTDADEHQYEEALTEIFARFGALQTQDARSEAARALVVELQDFITTHCYTCTDQVLLGLAEMAVGGGSVTERIDEAGGAGTAEFVREAIHAELKYAEK